MRPDVLRPGQMREEKPDAPPTTGSPAPGWPIVGVLTLAIGLLLLLTITLFFAASYQIARDSAAELVRDKSELALDSIEQRVRSQLDPVEAQIEYLASLIEREGLESRDRVAPLLVASLAAVPQVSAVAFVAGDLQVLRAFRHRAGHPVTLSDWSDDPGTQRMMSRVRGAESAYWGELFVAGEPGTTLINLFRPIRLEGEFAGALVAGVSIRELSGFLGSLEGHYLDNAFILYDRGLVLAHPLLQDEFPGLSDEHPLPTLSDLGDEILAQIWSPVRLARAETDFANAVQARVIGVAEQRFVFLFREIQGYGDMPWIIGTYVNLDEVAPQFRRLSYIGWFGLLALAIGLGLALLLSHYLSRPIRELASAAERVRDLELSEPPKFSRSPFRELNEVVGAYTRMVEGLRMFAAYVPKSLVRRLMGEHREAAVVSEEREVTIMFADIVGFTTLSEDLAAAKVVRFLNRHFTLVERCVEAEDGTIDKFMGDAVMALWGTPSDQPDHAARGCRAALGIAQAIADADVAQCDSDFPRLRVRIGIHSGRAVVGNIGAPGRINYTVIGDAVNTAERLEELSRAVVSEDDDVCIVISGDTAGRLGPQFQLAPLGRQILRGRHETVDVFRLVLPSEVTQAPLG